MAQYIQIQIKIVGVAHKRSGRRSAMVKSECFKL